MSDPTRHLLDRLREALKPLMHDPDPEAIEGSDWVERVEQERAECEDTALRVIAEALEGEVPSQRELAEWIADQFAEVWTAEDSDEVHYYLPAPGSELQQQERRHVEITTPKGRTVRWPIRSGRSKRRACSRSRATPSPRSCGRRGSA